MVSLEHDAVWVVCGWSETKELETAGVNKSELCSMVAQL